MLLPHYYRWPGVLILFLGVLLTYLRFGLGINPKIFECKVFAVYSTYFKTRYFSIIENNITEELCGIFILSGLLLIALTKEKIERPKYQQIRYLALMISMISSTAIVLFSFFFIYGTAFLFMLTLNIFLPLTVYNILFFIMLYRYNHQQEDVRL